MVFYFGYDGNVAAVRLYEIPYLIYVRSLTYERDRYYIYAILNCKQDIGLVGIA